MYAAGLHQDLRTYQPIAGKYKSIVTPIGSDSILETLPPMTQRVRVFAFNPTSSDLNFNLKVENYDTFKVRSLSAKLTPNVPTSQSYYAIAAMIPY